MGVKLKHYWRVLRREVSTGGLLGIVLGSVGLIRVLLGQMVGMDPATSSAPLVDTSVDVTGLVIYFFTATLMLKDTILAWCFRAGNHDWLPFNHVQEMDPGLLQPPEKPSCPPCGSV